MVKSWYSTSSLGVHQIELHFGGHQWCIDLLVCDAPWTVYQSEDVHTIKMIIVAFSACTNVASL
jgi:hypothetical protein